MDYDGEEDARSNLLVYLNGHLKGESSRRVLFAIGCRSPSASMWAY